MKQCISCLSNNVSPVVEKNHIFYYCSNCKSKHSNVIDNDGINYSTKQNGLIKHATIGVLIEKDNEVLLIKRKNYPFGYGIPSTHLHCDENVEGALRRLFLDKVGLEFKDKKLIFHQTLIDQCRYGGELHDCYLFSCQVENFIFSGTDQNLIWQKKKNLHNIDLIPNAKLIFSRINYLENKNLPVKIGLDNRLLPVQEKSIIDSLPFSIIIYSNKGKSTFVNSPAAKLLNTLEKENAREFAMLNDALTRLAKKTISAKSTFAENFSYKHQVYNLVSQPLLGEDRKCGATIIIKNISQERELDVQDILAHQTSISLCANTNFSVIVRAIMKKMFYSMNITSASLMILHNEELKTIFHYSAISKTKRKPVIIKLGQGVAGWVAQNETLLAVPNTDKDPLFTGSAQPSEKSLLCLPVMSNNKVLGVINLTKAKDNYFTEKEMSSASIVANRIALAIENEKLYQQLKTDEKKTASIIENSAEGITAETADGEIIIWNKQMREITGFATAEEYIRANAERIKRISDATKRAAELGSDSFYEELEIVNAFGEKQWIGRTFSIVRNEKKEVDLLIVQVRDLSKEKLIETKQNEFIYTTTHELRTPITAIKGYLSMIINEDAGKINSTQKKYFSRVYDSTERLVNLVEDLLAVAKVEEGEINFELAPFDLRRMMKEVAKEFKIKAKDKKIKIQLSGQSIEQVVIGDENRTKQALSNLVENAIKYTNRGNIKISLKNNERYAVVSVSDTGVGIPRKELKSVFDRFYRVPNALSVEAGGTGLGLYIVKKLIERQKGKVEVTSGLGKGSTFSILLPLEKKEKND